jgi:hypothetical protein
MLMRQEARENRRSARSRPVPIGEKIREDKAFISKRSKIRRRLSLEPIGIEPVWSQSIYNDQEYRPIRLADRNPARLFALETREIASHLRDRQRKG